MIDKWKTAYEPISRVFPGPSLVTRHLSFVIFLLLLLVFSLPPSALALSVLIDPGHGGSDPGAVGNGLHEADLNLDTGLRLRNQLVECGDYVSYLTRTDDTYVSLSGRTDYANYLGVTRFLSIHCNAGGGTGTETFYYTGNSTGQNLAIKVQDEVVLHLQSVSRRVIDDLSYLGYHLYVLAHTNMPAVLTELLFVDQAADAAKLADPNIRQEAARAIRHAIQQHYSGTDYDCNVLASPTPSPTSAPSSEYIIESHFTGSHNDWYSEVGDWVNSNFSYCTAPGCQAQRTRYTSAAYPGRTATHQPNLSQTGNYEVYATWGDSGVDGATYLVHSATGEQAVPVNQSTAQADTWISLGTFTFVAGDGGYVELSRGSATAGVLRSAAVKFALRGSATIPPSSTPTKTPTTGPASPTPTAAPVTGEFRGLWVTRWDFSTPSDVVAIIQKATDAHFNAVFFQIRGEADAYYASSFEPWAKRLSGTLGQDPGWDPLTTAIGEAHAQGIQLHAWINTLASWSQSSPPPPSIPPHILYSHPGWVMVDSAGRPMPYGGDYVFVAPGIPAVQEHLERVVRDIVARYNVDGIHFDYIRYPGSQYSHDTVTNERFQNDNPGGLGWEDFQRLQLNTLVERLSRAAWEERSSVMASAAVFGVYRDFWSWGASQAYTNYYQDWWTWMDREVIDAAFPMTYWNLLGPGRNPPYFDVLYQRYLGRTWTRFLFAGIWGDFSDSTEIGDQIAFLRANGIPGHAIFSYSLIQSRNLWTYFKNTVYPSPASVPVMSWKSSATSTPTQPQAFTPTPSASPAPSSTPLPTDHPSNSFTPTPSSEPTLRPSGTPEPSPTFTPEPEPPAILYGGYLDTHLTGQGGPLTLLCELNQPSLGLSLDIYFDGRPTGLVLVPENGPGSTRYLFRTDALPGLSRNRFLFELALNGSWGSRWGWPYLTVP